MPILRTVSELELENKCKSLSRLIGTDYHERIKQGEYLNIYGIPNGGVHAAMRVSKALFEIDINNRIVWELHNADIIIDDLVDSGRTMHEFMRRAKDMDPDPNFYALYIKGDSDFTEGTYLVFPWEGPTGGIDENIVRVLEYIGEDPKRDGLVNTPGRIAKMYQEIFAGYSFSDKDITDLCTTFDNDGGYDEMIMLRDIPFYSMCEHHMLPFFGKVHIAYIPNTNKGAKIIGISKLARLTDIFARRLQVQERMTRQIADTIQRVTLSSGVAVIVEGQHLCMQMRGVQKPGSAMITSSLLGNMKNQEARMEFLLLKR